MFFENFDKKRIKKNSKFASTAYKFQPFFTGEI
jgi:hypothetical protein